MLKELGLERSPPGQLRRSTFNLRQRPILAKKCLLAQKSLAFFIFRDMVNANSLRLGRKVACAREVSFWSSGPFE
jgi:hypothetical protein